MGDLAYSSSNNKTLKVILELVHCRQKDMSNRQKTKEEMAKIAFDRDKYRSLLDQAKITIAEKEKHVGKLENQLNDLNLKVRKS